MILQWMVYALAVSAWVSAAAWLAEQGARAQRWPTRWAWAGGLAASLGLVVVAWLFPPEAVGGGSMVAAPGEFVMEALPVLAAPPEAVTGPDPATLALAGWAGLSALLLGGIIVLAVRLMFRRRRWRRTRVDGVDVWVSRRTGPAALGLFRGQVVVPEWALDMEGGLRRMLVLHEGEHVRARDPQLALAGLVVCALMPWNLPLWWQLRRLRLAIEVDCDERVLRRGGDARGYGALLLDVCQRKAHLAVALAESRSMLERRIRMITKATKGPATLRAVGLAAVAGLVLAVACETPGPVAPVAPEQNRLELRDVAANAGETECNPAVFLNGGVSDMVAVGSMDPAAIESVHVFRPAVGKDLPEGAVSCGVVAVLSDDAGVEAADRHRRLVEMLTERSRPVVDVPPPPAPSGGEIMEEPTFTPMTVAPQLVNRDAVVQALEDHYPPSLRDAGVGGAVNVWFFIDNEGSVLRTLVNRTSGNDALDEAALAVAGTMEFTPAYNREQRVPVWVALDIRFPVHSGNSESGG